MKGEKRIAILIYSMSKSLFKTNSEHSQTPDPNETEKTNIEMRLVFGLKLPVSCLHDQGQSLQTS